MELTMPSWLRSDCAFDVNQTALMMDQSREFTILSLFKSPASGTVIGDGVGAGVGVTEQDGSPFTIVHLGELVGSQRYQPTVAERGSWT